MKKTLITTCFISVGMLALSQDTLRVSDVRLAFDTTATQFYEDTLSLTYKTEYIGDDPDPEFIQKVNVINSSGTFMEIEDSVLTLPEITPISAGSEYEMSASLRLNRSVFKDGNNTVVIWPGKTDGPFVVKDPTEFEIFIGGPKNIFTLSSLEHSIRVINNELIISNESTQNQIIQIYNLNGQLFKQSVVTSKDVSSLYIPSGIFVVALISGKDKKAVKILVE